MDCCAILVNYRGAEDTAAAARSVFADQPSLQVVVIDNSTDDVEFAKLKQLLPVEAQLIAAPQNLGFGRACNWAFNLSNAAFVLLVNPDVRIIPGCIATLLEEMRADDRLGAVGPRQFLDDACRWQLPPSWFPTALRAWATEMALRNRRYAKRLSHGLRAESLRFWTASQTVSQRSLSGGAMLIRRGAIDASQELFDPRFFMYFEDSDLCCRVKQGGYRVGVVPQAKAVHRWRNQAHKGPLMAEAAALYFAKHWGSENLWHEKSAQLVKAPELKQLLGGSRAFPEAGLVVPTSWESGWLLELSPSPLVSPAIGLFGTGPLVSFPQDALANFEGAKVFGRLGPSFTPVAADNYWYFEWNSGSSTEDV